MTTALRLLSLHSPALSTSSNYYPLPPPFFTIPASSSSSSSSWTRPALLLIRRPPHTPPFVCRMAEYKFPDPIPEFAVSEIDKFEEHMFKKLSKRDTLFVDSIPQVVGICTQILNTFLHTEYQGPGTLLVDPFIDMADTIREQGLPGAPQAARIAVKWAQKHVDKDWKEWTGFDL